MKTRVDRYLPAGTHKITVSLNTGLADVTVVVTKEDVAKLNKSLDKRSWIAETYEEVNMVGIPAKFVWREDGIYLKWLPIKTIPKGVLCACFATTVSDPREIVGAARGCVGYFSMQPSFTWP